ncbi:MAG: hypothetical protein H7343_11025 [Undibacterium sp.]|nr:hypothetical protein [Opitutaceae bacterium]
MFAIRENIEGTNQSFCVAAYIALRWKANEGINHEGPFAASVSDIAARAGCSYNKAAKSLNVLESIGVVTIEKQFCEDNKTRSPSLYTFPASGGTLPRAKGNPLPALRATPSPQTDGSSVPIIEKERKERKELKIASGEPAAIEPRARDLIFEALAKVDNVKIAELTGGGRGSLNKARAEIFKASPNVTPAEITRRAAILRAMYPTATMSAAFLAKHWARCGNMPQDPSSYAAAETRRLEREAAAEDKAKAEREHESFNNPFLNNLTNETAAAAGITP